MLIETRTVPSNQGGLPSRLEKLRNYSCQNLMEQIGMEKVECQRWKSISAWERYNCCMSCWERLRNIKQALSQNLARDDYLREIFEVWFEKIDSSMKAALDSRAA